MVCHSLLEPDVYEILTFHVMCRPIVSGSYDMPARHWSSSPQLSRADGFHFIASRGRLSLCDKSLGAMTSRKTLGAMTYKSWGVNTNNAVAKVAKVLHLRHRCVPSEVRTDM